MNSVAFTDRKSASQIYRRLVKCIPSALMPFRPCSTGFTRSALCMPRTATPAHRVVPVRNRANIISVSTFIGSAAFLLFFAATEGNDRARARLVFIIYKRCESGGYMPSRIHLNRTAMNVSSYRHTPKYRRPGKWAVLLRALVRATDEGRDDGACRSTKLVRGRWPEH